MQCNTHELTTFTDFHSK